MAEVLQQVNHQDTDLVVVEGQDTGMVKEALYQQPEVEIVTQEVMLK